LKESGSVVDLVDSTASSGALATACQRKDWVRPLFLVGGLTPENVAGAVRRVRPYAVDVSSGVEAAPDKKDPSKVKAFV